MQVAAGLGTGTSPLHLQTIMDHNLTPIAAAVQTSAPALADFDFNVYEELTSAFLTIRDPKTNRPTKMVVELAGVEHPARKKRLFDRQRRLRAEAARLGKMPVVDPIEAEEQETDDLVAIVLGWTGSAVPFSQAAAREAFTNPKLRWLRDQVKAGLDERELFIRSSAAA